MTLEGWAAWDLVADGALLVRAGLDASVVGLDLNLAARLARLQGHDTLAVVTLLRAALPALAVLNEDGGDAGEDDLDG